MNSWIKLGVAAFLAPSLTAGVLLLVGALTGMVIGTGMVAILAAGMLLLVVALFAVLGSALRRALHNRFSPVRRKYPRPTAWHQWR